MTRQGRIDSNEIPHSPRGRRCCPATHPAASEAPLQYHSNKFFAWGSGPGGDDGSVALEQRLQGYTPVIPSGSSPRRGARRASQAFSKSGMTHLGLFEWYWCRHTSTFNLRKFLSPSMLTVCVTQHFGSFALSVLTNKTL